MTSVEKIYKYLIANPWVGIGSFALISGGIPFISGYTHLGNVALIIYGSLIMCATKRYKDHHSYTNPLWFFIKFVTFVGVGMLIIMLQSAYMSSYKGEDPATVIVMGCMVEDGEASNMLKARLNVAYNELEENPSYSCVVTGGLTDGEPLSESEVMKNYLVDRGIDPSRIYQEDKATDTEENITNSVNIIAENNLPENVIIATDGFHQFRSLYYSRWLGFESYSTSSLSALGLVVGYYTREMLAILEMLLMFNQG